ncbi:MAG: 16S rRNA (adenine(1518)-N(6)/adenine(1519)-N(6))-dimethyltransferase RsmA [Magnetovibrionaceae bacterium]
MPADDLPPLRDVIAEHGLGAKKKLGQHFLLDLNLTRRIAREAGDLAGKTVLEVGPGPGGLTRALLETDAAQVIAIERDERCIRALAPLQDRYGDRFRLIEADALTIAIEDLTDLPLTIVANLPYNVATPLMIAWLRQRQLVSSMTVMVQNEVADRLVAGPGTKSYGRLAVLAHWLSSPRKVMHVPASAFTPPPRVESAVVRMDLRDEPLIDVPFEAIEFITAKAFGQRRKMLRQSLKALNLDLAALDIDPTARPENLDVEQFCRLAGAAKPG